MNFIQIAGRVGRDPETRFTPDGKKVISFSIATNRKRKGQEETVWYRVTIWGDQYDNMMPYIKKGTALIVVGDLDAGLYTDKEGKPQVSLDINAKMITFSPFGGKSDSKEEGGHGSTSHNEYSSETQRGTGSYQPASSSNSFNEEDLPF